MTSQARNYLQLFGHFLLTTVPGDDSGEYVKPIVRLQRLKSCFFNFIMGLLVIIAGLIALMKIQDDNE